MKLFDATPVRGLVARALREDIGPGDITSEALIPPSARGHARMIFRQPGVACGLPLVSMVFHALNPRVRVTLQVREGSAVRRGTSVATLRGPLRSLLAGERTALNFLQRLSGIATLTRRFVARGRGTRARIVDTRKTTPGMRILEKYAVRMGGGTNHRFGLYDAVLVKDNHLAYCRDKKLLAEKIREMRKLLPRGTRIEIEARTGREAVAFAAMDIDILMLDNFSSGRIAATIRNIRKVRRNLLIEVSGGVTLSSVSLIAKAGADRISIGALTHSAPACDISMDIRPL